MILLNSFRRGLLNGMCQSNGIRDVECFMVRFILLSLFAIRGFLFVIMICSMFMILEKSIRQLDTDTGKEYRLSVEPHVLFEHVDQ